jgi:hypothetical protein
MFWLGVFAGLALWIVAGLCLVGYLLVHDPGLRHGRTS